MSTTNTTTTTIAPNGETTIQKVESAAERDWVEVSAFWQKVGTYLSHLETAARASGWFSIAYAAYTFARHLV